MQIISHTQQKADNANRNGSTIESHLFDTAAEFTGHLTQKRQSILASILHAVKHTNSDPPLQTDRLEEQVRDLTGRLKIAELNVRKLQIEKDEREPRIIDLQERLISSQRKIDRQKSITLARIEMQARKVPADITPAPTKTESDMKEDSKVEQKQSEPINGLKDEDKEDVSATHERLLTELSDLQNQIASLKEQNAGLRGRMEHLQDSDIEQSLPYRELKIANESLRGQNEFLSRLNVEASQESSDLKAERTTFRDSLVQEHTLQYEEITQQLTKTEHDLARVRTARDELHSNLQIRKAQDDTRAASAREISELADAQAVSSCLSKSLWTIS